MKIIYATDLHGNHNKYKKIINIAIETQAYAVINGGDMFPKNKLLHEQGEFIRNELHKHFEQFEQNRIHYLCYPGNDDLKIFDPLFQGECSSFKYIHDVAQKRITINNIDFIGMNWVVDYPFRLKDRCRMDHKDYKFQQQFGTGLLSVENGWKEIDDWPGYAAKLPTIEDELENLPEPHNEQAVYIIHMPPVELGLDVCMDGRTVGSESVYEFIKKKQPLFSLHGHIHESPDVSGIWKNKIGDTVAIQPGQLEMLTYVIIDTETKAAERFQI